MKKFARQCSITGELMNEGWVWYDGTFYAKHLEDAAREIRGELADGVYDEECIGSGLTPQGVSELSDADLMEWVFEYTDGDIYFTEWEEGEDDFQYAIDDDGKIIELF